MKKLKKVFHQLCSKAIVCFLVLQVANTSHAQTAADSAKAVLLAIDSAYNHAFYLGFDVKITYSSDTLWAGTDSADFTYTEMLGHYTFNGNKALYKLGDIDYLQNDSFTIALYKENKILLVGKPVPGQTTSSLMPAKPILDSMLVLLDSAYNCFIEEENDGQKCIHFNATDTTITFTHIHVHYDPTSYLLTKVEYEMKDYGYNDIIISINQAAVVRDATLTFDFMNHRIDRVDPEVFSETKYLFFDGPAEIKPAAAYKDFTIYKNF